jgi:hypothetical protein
MFPPFPPFPVIVAFGVPEDGNKNVVAVPSPPEVPEAPVPPGPIVTVPVFVSSITNNPTYVPPVLPPDPTELFTPDTAPPPAPPPPVTITRARVVPAVGVYVPVAVIYLIPFIPANSDHESIPAPSFCKIEFATPCALGIVAVYDVVVAAGLSVRVPDVEPDSARVLTPARSAVSERVTDDVFNDAPVVSVNLVSAVAVEELGPTGIVANAFPETDKRMAFRVVSG